MSEWKESELGEIINLKRGYDLPSSNRIDGCVPIISSSGITGYHNEHKQIGPGVVTGRYGTLGEFFLIKHGEKYWPLNTTLFVEDFNGNNPEFIYYFLQTLDFERFGHKSAVPGLNRNELHEILVKLPDAETQKEIAKTLSHLDKKITLLRQQNQTLEELAQTLFKRWFVEFEFPNENGETYKSSGGKMVESELGEIPEGWRLASLGELSSLKSGYAFKSNDFVGNSSVKAVKIKDLKGKGVVEISDVSSVSEQVATIERVKYFRLKEGDIVLAMSGNTTGKIGVIPPHEDELYLNQRVGKFFLKESSYKGFLYNFLMSGNYEERILSMGYGSAQPNINPTQIESIEVLIPSEDVLTGYIKISEPIYNKVLVNNEEVQTLAQLRDTLLPKLMSGELRVK